jgi:hypothetical protein
MKYRDAIRWIAENDDPGHECAWSYDVVADQLTVQMIAALRGKTATLIACDVVIYRLKKYTAKGENHDSDTAVPG